jgi:hypothetical protein
MYEKTSKTEKKPTYQAVISNKKGTGNSQKNNKSDHKKDDSGQSENLPEYKSSSFTVAQQ